MHKPQLFRSLLQAIAHRALLAFGMAISLSACVGLAGGVSAGSAGGDTWQEEVLQ